MTAFFLEQPNKTLDGTHATAAPTGQLRLEHGAGSVLNLGTRCLSKNKSPFDLLHQKTLTSFIIYAGPPCSIMWHKPGAGMRLGNGITFSSTLTLKSVKSSGFKGKTSAFCP